MKKNLRIVSAAAAALLAVAPVAASAVSVNADPVHEITLAGNAPAVKGDITLSSSLAATTTPGQTVINNNNGAVTYQNWNGRVSGTISASYNGQSYTVNLPEDFSGATVYKHVNRPSVSEEANWTTDGANWSSNNTDGSAIKNGNIYQLEPGETYYLQITGATFNFGSANANKKLTVVGSNGIRILKNNEWSNGKIEMDTDQNGATVNNYTILVPIKAANTANTRSVQFFEKSTGNAVTAGNVSVNANSNSVLNVNALLSAITSKYGAHQYEYSNQSKNAEITTTAKDLTDQLNKLGMKVDAQGNFTANKSFNVTINAKSDDNAYTNSMVVAVSVPNGKDATTPASNAVSKTVMHIAAIYNKEGKQTNDAKLRAYNSVSVLPDAVTINGSKMYQVVENGQAVDKYVKASNIDGTSKTLKHNAYVYTQYGKKVYTKSGKTVKLTKKVKRSTLRKEANGNSVTVYGGALFNKQYYRIGKNQYIKVANFR